MFLRLVLLFTLLPLVELYLLIKVGSYLGAGLTVLLVFGTGVAGVYLARREGWRTWRKIQADLHSGVAPAAEMVDGMLILAAGLLLITPGLLTDLFGFGLLFPLTRSALKEYLRRRFEQHVHSTSIEIHLNRWP